ncbi:MAG TPA: Hsp70 family protein [Lacipirellulaceae bacterium]|nr:Hsp70 family protein [Lacipirellulaceae bacterium]
MQPIIGIDLGTTNSLCAIFQDGAPQLIPNALGETLTPSVVGITEKGDVIVGAAAKELRVTQPDRCASYFKRFMGSNESVSVAGKSFTPVELSSLVLKSLRYDARHTLNADVLDAVITVPAYFNDNQRQATKRAGELAGLNVRRIVNEPTAAALTYGFHDRNAEKKILVIDLGGGTFDVTLMEVFEGTLEIISTAGESFLGGEDFTDRLVAALLQREGLQLEVAELREPRRVARMRQLCEVAKQQLTKSETAQVQFPDANGNLAENVPPVHVSRTDFATFVQPLMDRITMPVAKALRDGRSSIDDIADVILVGGATRMASVHDFVRSYFDKEPLCKFNPDEVVALGAAVQAALIADDRAVEDLVMTDVCPHTLGIEVAKEFTGEYKQGYFVPIIHRNTTIPVSKEKIFQTIAPNQREVNVVVYQGEHRRVEQNLKIGELSVTGIPPGPAGKKFFVRFTYDLNGILEVEAYLPESTHKFRTVLTQSARHLDQSELEAAIRKLQSLKYYPREDMEYQRLLRYCERLVGEVSPFHRQELEAAIDGFEAALNSGEREAVEFAHNGLLQILSVLGYEFPGNGN